MTTELPAAPRHPSDDQLLDLALGLPDADTAAALRAHLTQCTACDARFRATVGDLERSRARAATALAGTGRARRRTGSIVWLAAAAVLLVLGGVWWNRTGDLSALRTEKAPLLSRFADPGAFAPHRDVSEGEASMRAALGLYEAGDYAGASAALAALDSLSPPLDRMRRVYLADCLARREDWAGVVTATGALRMMDVPEPWQSQARWSLAVAYARLGKVSEARTTLLELERVGSPLSPRADSALRGLLR